jgi:hypothetical protein
MQDRGNDRFEIDAFWQNGRRGDRADRRGELRARLGDLREANTRPRESRAELNDARQR